MWGCRWALQQLRLGFCAGDAGGFLGLTSTEVNAICKSKSCLCSCTSVWFVGICFPSTKWGGVSCIWGWGCCWNSHVIQTAWPLCVANSVEMEDGAEILNCPVFDVVTRCSIFSFRKMILINILPHLYNPWGLFSKMQKDLSRLQRLTWNEVWKCLALE